MTTGGRGRQVALAATGGVAGLVLWEAYKAVGPETGFSVGSVALLPRTSDLAMPHTWEVVARFGQPTSSAPDAPTVLADLVAASATTLGIALAGWLVGVVVGVLLALAMTRLRVAQDALLPWIILSQTVPLVALAPLVAGWSGSIAVGPFEWTPWMSVALIASYLAFFPVAVGMLKGLTSPEVIHTDLMRSYDAGWLRTVWSLRLPASVPYALPALRLGAAAAIVGAIVAEVSTGTDGGIGRLVITYAQSASGDPAKPWTAIVAASLLGLVAAGLVSLLGLGLRRYRFSEVTP
ncbi:ABC transporter permease subunit [Sanguibacter sp. 25GB23B1]|uniref:ABC transporter permease n=1 Tax=unclassified Sanguibacter TaxID=2645534 RepID=UPI0032AFB82C